MLISRASIPSVTIWSVRPAKATARSWSISCAIIAPSLVYNCAECSQNDGFTHQGVSLFPTRISRPTNNRGGREKSPSLCQPVADGERSRRRPVVHLQFAKDIGEMVSDCFFAEDKLLGDCTVTFP